MLVSNKTVLTSDPNGLWTGQTSLADMGNKTKNSSCFKFTEGWINHFCIFSFLSCPCIVSQNSTNHGTEVSFPKFPKLSFSYFFKGQVLRCWKHSIHHMLAGDFFSLLCYSFSFYFETESYYVAQVGLENSINLSASSTSALGFMCHMWLLGFETCSAEQNSFLVL